VSRGVKALTKRVGHSAWLLPQPALVFDKAATDPRQSNSGTTIHDAFLAVVDWRRMTGIVRSVQAMGATKSRAGAVEELYRIP